MDDPKDSAGLETAAARVSDARAAAGLRRAIDRGAARLRGGMMRVRVAMASRPRAALPPRIAELFRSEAEQGRRRQFLGRQATLIVAMLLATLFESFPATLWYYGFIFCFYLTGLVQQRVWSSGAARAWHSYAFATLDIALLTAALQAPNPLSDAGYPPQMELRFDNFVYLFFPIVAPIFTYQPRLVLWNGVSAAAFWMLGVAILASLPDSLTSLPEAGGWAAPGSTVLAPTFVDWRGALHDCLLLVVISALLAFAVARVRRLVWRYAGSERERANLARFLPPAMVDRFAAQDHALGVVRERPAAVLFVDLIGFTAWAEKRAPARVIETLRDVLERLETTVFRHGGALDKFTGDGLLATFGAFDDGARPATNALACVRALIQTFDAWNAERERRGEDPLRLAIGLHFGPVVVGDIGSHRRLELTVIGDSVNVSNRLESLTRVIGRRAAVSQHLVDAVARELDGKPSGAPVDDAVAAGAVLGEGEDRFGEALLGLLEPAGEHVLRGRKEPVRVWAYREA